MDPQRQQVVQKIKEANNVLVTVSSNPSVDQLAACIGLTLALNKLGKHATAVFSGEAPSTLEFLQPEKTLEKTTDSLRDFIISIDKSKADKLRYKVEDQVVKIFITPYKTSITNSDLEFSQGDFNVDVIVALGVHNQTDLDQVITAHGRILHDATVITINQQAGIDELGGVNWIDTSASSLSQLAAEALGDLDKKVIDNQIATALLTGIVAATERFSNINTSPKAMSVSAELMSAGADQQLVATKLAEPVIAPPAYDQSEDTIEYNNGDQPPAPTEPPEEAIPVPEPVTEPGSLEILHDNSAPEPTVEPTPEPSPESVLQLPVPENEQQDLVLPPEMTQPVTVVQNDVPSETAQQPSVESPLQEIADELSTTSSDAPAEPAELQPQIIQNDDVSQQIHIDEHGMITPAQAPSGLPAASSTPSIIKEHNIMRSDPPTQQGEDADGSANQADFSEDIENPSGGAPGAGNSFIIGSHAPGGSNASNHQTVESNATVFEPIAPPTVEHNLQSSPTGDTLADIEQEVNSPHLQQAPDDSQSPDSMMMPSPVIVAPTIPPRRHEAAPRQLEPQVVVGGGGYDPDSPPPVPPPMMPPSSY